LIWLFQLELKALSLARARENPCSYHWQLTQASSELSQSAQRNKKVTAPEKNVKVAV
jgi:hypothetical protein